MSTLPPPSFLRAGLHLDRYELLAPVAQGGMAQVWVARLRGIRGFERLVAVKAILAQHAMDPQFQKMFLDEARLVSSIHHRNVAQVLDLGEINDVLYLVMEWVEGDSLSALRRIVSGAGETFPVAIALRIVSDVLEGLHAAHELRAEDGRPLSVVHRDVSPSNILVTTSGEAKVIDFGIAKAIDRIAEETASGFLRGKITYMAPEQAMGKKVDRRADIFAAGAVLYQLLSGEVPYRAENQIESLHLLLQGEPPKPLTNVPADVAEAVYVALSHNQDARFATADEMHRALTEALIRNFGATTSADVAKLVNEKLAKRLATRKRQLEISLQAAQERARLDKELESEVVTDSNSLLSVQRPARAASSPDVETQLDAPPRRPPIPADAALAPDAVSTTTLAHATLVSQPAVANRTRRALLAVGLGLLGLFAIYGVFSAVRGASKTSEAAAASPPTSVEPAPVPAAAGSVTSGAKAEAPASAMPSIPPARSASARTVASAPPIPAAPQPKVAPTKPVLSQPKRQGGSSVVDAFGSGRR